METEIQLKVSSDRLVKLEIEPRPLVKKARSLSARPQGLHHTKSCVLMDLTPGAIFRFFCCWFKVPVNCHAISLASERRRQCCGTSACRSDHVTERLVLPTVNYSVQGSITGSPRVFFWIWGEWLFLFGELGSTGNYFRGSGEQAHSFRD